MPKSEEKGRIYVRELDCPTEQGRIAQVLDGRPGIHLLDYDLNHREVEIVFDPALVSLEDVSESIRRDCGYQCKIISADEQINGRTSETQKTGLIVELLTSRKSLVLIAALALLTGLLFWLVGPKFAEITFYAISICFSLAWIGPRLLLSVSNRRMDIFGLVGLAIVGAIVLGLWDEAATVGVLFGVSELLESFAAQRARVSINSLMALQPDQAERLEKDGSWQIIDPSQLQVGETVRVRPGQKIPIDGIVRQGETHIDQKVITGESVLVEARSGSEVFAGTLNSDGMIQVEATRQLSESIVSQIAKKVGQAQTRRAPIERIVDQFARLYTPIIVFVASLIITIPPIYSLLLNQPTHWRDWLFRGLVLLVIACPCALVISTPVAVVCALANAARHGILVREGFVIEQFSQLQFIAFDKTGTLTEGQPRVQEILNLTKHLSDQEIMGIAASLGQEGSHVVSRALVRFAEENAIEIPRASDVKEIPGLGTIGNVNGELIYLGSHRFIEGEGLCRATDHQKITEAEKLAGTGVMIASRENAIAFVRLADRPREESQNTLAELKKMNVSTMMLTGDNFNTASEVASIIGIEEFHAEMMPQEKSELIEKLVQKESKKVGMVGDGVNDAPSLVAATVGISMGKIASAITSQAADVVLMNNNLNSICRLIRLSRATTFIIRTNIILATGAKLLVMILAILGMANFLMAMLSDVGVSLIVIMNSLRILKYELK